MQLKYAAVLSLAALCSCASTPPYHFSNTEHHTSPSVTVQYETRSILPIRDMLENLENVPDVIQQKVNAYGGIVVFCEGKLTNQPELRDLRGQQVPQEDELWDDKPGITSGKQAFVRIDHNLLPHERVELHEYGHLVDKALSLSSSEEFLELCREERPKELFAIWFADFYASDMHRSFFHFNNPLAHEFYRTLEEKLVEQH